MEKKQDLRILKTREAIKDAFIELVEEKGFEAMTIKDITEKARINRGTFYAHYEDKYQCMASYEEEFIQGMISIAKKLRPMDQQVIEKDTPLPIAIDVFNYIFKNRNMLKAFLSSHGVPYFQEKLKQAMWEQLYEKSKIKFIDPTKMLVSPHYFSSYIAGAHISVIQTWLNNGCQESPEEMAKVLSTLTAKGPFFAAGIVT